MEKQISYGNVRVARYLGLLSLVITALLTRFVLYSTLNFYFCSTNSSIVHFSFVNHSNLKHQPSFLPSIFPFTVLFPSSILAQKSPFTNTNPLLFYLSFNKSANQAPPSKRLLNPTCTRLHQPNNPSSNSTAADSSSPNLKPM